MREHVVIDVSGILVLAVVCLGVPYLAWKSSKRIGSGPLPIAKKRFFIQTIFAQLYLFGLAAAAAWRNGIDLLAKPPEPLRAYALAALFLAVLLAVMRWRWPHRGEESKEKLIRLLPRDHSELPPYFVLCLTAGVCEEVVYRGVTTVLLARITGSLVAAIAIASIVFALAHVIQGRRATMVVLVIALGAHALVLLTRSLFPVMAVHALYDAAAGVLMSRWYAREVRSAAQQQVLSQTTPIR
jgi:membrane protease YdiL (CAAX protease family)